MNVVLLGIPGSGKGTQANFLKRKLKLKAIFTGDLLREAVREKTKLGKNAKDFMEKGDLVPDQVLLDLIEGKIKEQKDFSGFVLDGFPRTLPQAQGFDLLLKKMGISLDYVIKLNLSKESSLKRLEGRLVCSFCGAFYNLETDPPKKNLLCDFCGNKLIRRTDDKKDLIDARIQVYQEKTEPVENYYRKQGKLKVVDGNAKADVVFERILAVLGK